MARLVQRLLRKNGQVLKLSKWPGRREAYEFANLFALAYQPKPEQHPPRTLVLGPAEYLRSKY